MLLSITLLNLLSLVNTAFFPVYRKMRLGSKPAKEVGDPLFLSPYIRKGTIHLAQNLSRVRLTNAPSILSYAGFLTVNKKYNSNLYFWYFPPLCKNSSAPLLLWLQGGPGSSSLYGLFAELGPLRVISGDFFPRKYHWTQHFHMLFIDNPVGTGFSFTDNTNGYCDTQDCIAKSLYDALQQFFRLFPNLKHNDFYITGESYAGKYIPCLGMEIHNKNAHYGNPKINLKGMAIGNGFCDPINQLDYGNFLYQHGLLDGKELEVFLKTQMEIYVAIKKKNWLQANILMDRLLDGEVTHFSLFKYYTGFDFYYDYLQSTAKDEMRPLLELIHKNDIRRSMHIGGRPFQDGESVQLLLTLDMMQSVAPIIAELLSHYRMMFYNGQLDIVVAYPLTVNFLNNLRFSSSEDYRRANKIIWKVENSIAGYIKCAGNLTEALVRNAGHMVPKDQPKWALDLITRFIHNDYGSS